MLRDGPSPEVASERLSPAELRIPKKAGRQGAGRLAPLDATSEGAEIGHPLCTSGNPCPPVTCQPEQVRGRGSGEDSGQARLVTWKGSLEFQLAGHCFPQRHQMTGQDVDEALSLKLPKGEMDQ